MPNYSKIQLKHPAENSPSHNELQILGIACLLTLLMHSQLINLKISLTRTLKTKPTLHIKLKKLQLVIKLQNL